jgi:Rieske Fe-S protein
LPFASGTFNRTRKWAAMTDNPTLTRRGLIAAGGVTVAGASVLALAACSPSAEETPGATPSKAAGLAPGTELARLSDIPVGGSLGVQIGGSAVLLSHPEEGKAMAFSAICRHQGCVVAAAGASFDCPCHGSRYDAATGDVLNGPSVLPLIPIKVTVSEDRILVS